MLKVNSYSATGVKRGQVFLPKTFGEKVNLNLLAQASHVYESRRHFGTAYAKTRGEIAKSKRKIYRQKGTGGARHGARSAPIFVGGGVAHGPKGLKRVLKLPKRMREKALFMALNLKAKNKELIVINGLTKLKKTKEVALLVKKLSLEKKRLLFVVAGGSKSLIRAIRNLKETYVAPFSDLNAAQVILGGTILLDKNALSKGEK